MNDPIQQFQVLRETKSQTWQDDSNNTFPFDEPWMTFGACKLPENRGIDFFPSAGSNQYASAPAKACCVTCRVRKTCLIYALDNNIEYGIWGGENERSRKRLIALRKKTPKS